MDGPREGTNKCCTNCEMVCDKIQAVMEWLGLGAIIPSLSCIARSLLSMRTIFAVYLFWVFVLSVACIHFFSGVLSYKCVASGPPVKKSYGGQVISDDTNLEFGTVLCGFEPGSRSCPSDQVCTKMPQSILDYGYLNFDNMGWSYLTNLRLTTLDFWEAIYVPILVTKGYLNVWLFLVVMAGSACFLSLFLAVVMKKYASRQKAPEKKGFNFWPNNTSDSQGFGTTAAASNSSTNRCSRCTDFFCLWECCSCWKTFSGALRKFIFNPYTEMVTAVLLMMNVFSLCSDHDNIDIELFPYMRWLEIILVFFLLLEALVKILALSPKGYFSLSWQVFEFCMALIAFVELGLQVSHIFGFFFVIRMWRILRLGRYWPTLNFVFSGLGRCFKIQLILIIFYGLLFIFVAWIGTYLLSKSYLQYRYLYPDRDFPRWNFVDLMHSFMLVFRMLCGEWVETMYDCMAVNGMKCLPYYFIVLLLGKYLVVNVFLVFLVGCMESSRVKCKSKDETIDGLSKAVQQMQDVYRFTGYSKDRDDRVTLHADEELHNEANEAHLESVVCEKNELNSTQISGQLDSPPECWPPDKCHLCCPNLAVEPPVWTALRDLCLNVIQHWVFEVIVLIVIITGCIPISIHHLDSIHEANGVMKFLNVLSIFVPVAFLIEMIMKLIGYGFAHFFQSGWRTADLIIVIVVFVNMLTFSPGYVSFKVLQSLQAFRLMRVNKYFIRFQSFRVVLNTLLCSIPGIINMLLIVSLVWLIYAVMATQLYMHLFYSCVDVNGKMINSFIDRLGCLNKNHTWVKHSMTFDSLFESALSLFQVGTFKGWIGIIHSISDSTSYDSQPMKEASLSASMFLFLFISHVTVLTFAILLSILLASLNQNCETGGKDGFQGSRIYESVLQFIKNKTVSITGIPTGQFRAFLHHITIGLPFRLAVACSVIVGIIIMSCYDENLTESAKYGLNSGYAAIITLLSFEMLARFMGSANPLQAIICSPLSVLDLLALLFGVADLSSGRSVSFYVLAPPLLRLPRLAEVFWSFPLSRLFSGLRRVRFTMSRCLPFVCSIFVLLFMIIIVYSLLGVNVFHSVNLQTPTNYFYNFQSFGHAIIILFQLTTGAGWDGYYEAIGTYKVCDEYDEMHFGSCGSPLFSGFYIISFITVSYLILTLIPIVVVKYYKEVSDEVRLGLAPDNMDDFYTVWLKYDITGQSFIHYRDLTHFLDSLSGPLRLAKPNASHIALLDLPIYAGQKVYHQEVLAALARRRISQWGYQLDPKQDLEMSIGSPGVEAISSTLWRAHEEKSAKTIQTAWRRYKKPPKSWT